MPKLPLTAVYTSDSKRAEDTCNTIMDGFGFLSLFILLSAIVFALFIILFEFRQEDFVLHLLAIGSIPFLVLFLEIAVRYKRISPNTCMTAK